MFNKLFRRNQTTAKSGPSQHSLDVLRFTYANDQAMQLHLDRMQTAMNAR